MKNWRERINIDPNVCHGKPCIKGTRIWVSLIVDNLAAGATEDKIQKAYPALTKDDINAARAYVAARITHQRRLRLTVLTTTLNFSYFTLSEGD